MAAGGPLHQQWRQLPQTGQGPVLHLRQQLLLRRLQGVAPRLGEVLHYRGAQAGRGARLGRLRIRIAGARRGLLAGQLLPQGAYQGAIQLPAGGDIAEQLALVEAPHPHRVIDDGAATVQRWPVGFAGDRHHRLVQFGGEAPVEGQLLLAEEAASFQGGKIQEAEIQGFLDLVGKLPGEDDPGNVGFPQHRSLFAGGDEGRTVHQSQDAGVIQGRPLSLSGIAALAQGR